MWGERVRWHRVLVAGALVGLCVTGAVQARVARWHVLRGAPTESFYGPPTCVGADHCWAATGGRQIVYTRDGGRRWQRGLLPRGDVSEPVACMSTTFCWAPLYSPSRALPHP